MNLLTSLFSTDMPRPATVPAVLAVAARPSKRERAPGVGYGSSSGYAATPRFIPGRHALRLRFS